MKKLIILLIASSFYLSCVRNYKVLYDKVDSPKIVFSSDSIKVEGELGNFVLEINSQNIEEGLDIITINLKNPLAETPPKFTLKWNFPSVDIAKFWNPNLGVDKVTYYSNRVESSATRYAPVLSYLNTNDQNRITMAVADALNPITFGSYLKEEDANFHYYLQFFKDPYPKTKHYKTQILVDRRKQHFSKTLHHITDWWAKQDNYKPTSVPKEALRPMYSTWYSYHQNLDVKAIVEECRESKKIGMEAVIVDDGWQTLDNKRGYAYTGDWEPERIPDMKDFVQQIHDLDMKFLLWYSVPFIGKNAKNYDMFKGKYLYYWESQGAWVLDPRYPEVREFIIKIYEEAMERWNLDGFKLDFMAFFKPDEHTSLTATNGRDFASVYHAVDKLMTDIMGRLKEKKPEILIEFRQPYIGPLMRKYGNMLRAADCPNMATINRQRTTDTRLLGGDSAIHADMLMWHPDDTVEHAALQILNILFSVPQISVRLNEIPAEHKEMIAFWMHYWNQNQKVLMKGEFTAHKPDALYPMLQAEDVNKSIFALYNQNSLSTLGLKDKKEFDIINAQNETSLVLTNPNSLGKYTVKTFNCRGKMVHQSTLNLKQGALSIPVPPSGYVSFSKEF